MLLLEQAEHHVWVVDTNVRSLALSDGLIQVERVGNARLLHLMEYLR